MSLVPVSLAPKSQITLTLQNDAARFDGSPKPTPVSTETLSSSLPLEMAVKELVRGEAGLTGATGPRGPVGGVGQLGVAETALGGHRVVTYNSSSRLVYADKDMPGHFGKVAGITQSAVAAGDVVTFIGLGMLEEPSWNWNLSKPIFLGNNGVLTQVLTRTGFMQVVAFPVTPTSAFIRLQEPITTS